MTRRSAQRTLRKNVRTPPRAAELHVHFAGAEVVVGFVVTELPLR